MKKHNNRGIMIFSLLALTIILASTNVYAVDDSTKTQTTIDCSMYTDENAKKTCEANSEKCINELNEAGYSFKANLSNDQKSIDYMVTVNKSVTATYKVDVIILLDNKEVKRETISNIEGNKKYTYVLSTNIEKNKNYNVQLIATVESTGSVGTEVNCSQFYQGTESFQIGNVTVDKFENPYVRENGLCTQYRNGTLYGKESYAFSKIKNLSINVNGRVYTGEQYFNELFPYCNSNEVDYLIPEGEVKTQIMNTAQSVMSTHIASSSYVQPITIEPKYIEVKDVTKALNLYCDAFGTMDSNGYYKSEKNTKYFYHKETKAPIVANYKDSYNGTKSTKVCDVECVETVEATYGPPVAVKGSICFEYEITVKSKSVCTPKFNKDVVVPKKTQYSICNPVPICNQGQALYRNQAGPNEEFDQCVYELDGGKYKQSSINKCYDKVYKKKSDVKKQSSELNLVNEPVKKMANSNLPSYCDVSKFNSLLATSVGQSVYNMYTKEGYQGGYYEKVNGKITWKSCNNNQKQCKDRGIKFIDGCYWNNYARYYVASSRGYTIRTIQDDQYFYKKQYRNWEYQTTYYTAENGFKWAHYGNGNKCNENCTYTTNTCTGTGTNIKLNPSDKVSDNYDKDIQEYNSKVLQCRNQLSCENTKETKYKMSVNHSVGDIKVCKVDQTDDTDDCKVWSTTNKKGTKVTSVKGDILKEATGLCYDSSDTTNKYQYINTISFPGSWIRNKDGSVRYKKINNSNMPGYTYHKNEYCVSPKAGSVNDKWWNWDQSGRYSSNLNLITDSSGKLMYEQRTDSLGQKYYALTDNNNGNKDKTNGKYNIFGSMEDFGYFNWKLNFSCFYAVNNGGGGTTIPNIDSKNETDNTNGLKNSDTRTITLDKLFPESDAKTETVSNKTNDDIIPKKLNNNTAEEKVTKVADSSASRTPGYNWSCDATNLKITNYVIAPTALVKKIESQGENVYTDDEMDYEISLNPQQIKNIRYYNKDRDYFTFGTANYENNDNDINFYKSNFLSDNNYVNIKRSPKPKALCNNLKSKGTSCDDLSKYKEEVSGTCPKLNEA